VGLSGPFEIVLDRLGNVPAWPFGIVRFTVLGRWYAYVMKSASDRNTSGDVLHFTKLENASMNDGKTSSEKVSAFRASRNRFTMPIF